MQVLVVRTEGRNGVHDQNRGVGDAAKRSTQKRDDQGGLKSTDDVRHRRTQPLDSVELRENSGGVLRLQKLVDSPYREDDGDADAEGQQWQTKFVLNIRISDLI